MKIAEVTFEEFMAWMGHLEENLKDCPDLLLEAAERVPLIARLLFIHNNAVEHDAEETMLTRGRDVINVLISLYELEKGRAAPSDGRSGKRPQRIAKTSCRALGPRRLTDSRTSKGRRKVAEGE